jgi:hypothetical protein
MYPIGFTIAPINQCQCQYLALTPFFESIFFESPIRVLEKRSAFRRRAQRNAFRHHDVRLQTKCLDNLDALRVKSVSNRSAVPIALIE